MRKGGKFEAGGFLLILAGMVSAVAAPSILTGALLCGGFIVFLIGRFM